MDEVSRAAFGGAKCSHPYLRKLSLDKSVCLECGGIVDKDAGRLYDTSPLIMPPQIYAMTEEYWDHINPWPLLPVAVPVKYGWYGSMIYNREYLVMPVFEKGVPVFYSARCVEKGCPKKYKYQTPEGRQKKMWKSDVKGEYVLVGEGIADAAYMSQLSTSVALLGGHGTFKERVIVVLDGDPKGIEFAFQIVQGLRKAGIVDAMTVILPNGKDPTDVPLYKLSHIIFEQTGIQL